VSKDAVRMRVKRGTLRSEKGPDGRVYVWVNVNPDGNPNTVHPEPRVDAYRELVEELRDRVRSLEEANRENRRIIAALTQRIPEIEAPRNQEAPQEPPEAPVAATEQPGRVGPQPPLEASMTEPSESPERPPAEPERVEPVEPVDPKREEPEPADPKRAEPERVEPEIPADEQQGRGPVPDSGGPRQEDAKLPWWRRVFGG